MRNRADRLQAGRRIEKRDRQTDSLGDRQRHGREATETRTEQIDSQGCKIAALHRANVARL